MSIARTAPPSGFHHDTVDALRLTGLLDSPAEETFDCFSRLAATLLRTSAAMVTFADGERLFIKSSVGLPEPWATERQATRGHSYCWRVVESGAPVVVRDLSSDMQALYYPSDLDGGGVTYLGVPVRGPDGVVLGALAVLDSAPREFGREEIALLEKLAAGVTALVVQHASRTRETGVEAALRRELDQLRATTTTARMGEWVWEIESGAVAMSALAAELHGTPPPEDFDAYLARIHADDRARVLRQIRQAVQGAASYEVEYRVAGESRAAPTWVHMRAGVARDAGGRALRIAGLCHDISARRERELVLQRMGAFLEEIVAHAPIAVILTTADGVVGLWNAEAEHIFGWAPEDCIGAPLRIVPPEWAEDYRMVRDALAHGKRVSGLETRAVRRDGSSLDVSLAVVRLVEHAVELGSDVYLVTPISGGR